MTIAVGLGALILVYGAYGYGINTKTGEIIQNGLLFVDSKPGGAEIFLNGVDQHTTSSARLVLPAGKYTLTLKRTGYLDWQRSFVLEEHSIARFVYPFLIPVKPVDTTLKVYPAQPGVITQSPDRKWLVVQNQGSVVRTARFDIYDTSDLTQPNKVISLPEGLLSDFTAASKLEAVEWSTDNVHLVLKHSFAGGDEFILMDRSDPAKSININKTFKIAPASVAMRNKKIAQLYIYDKDTRELSLADVEKQTVDKPFLKDVLAFKPYGNTLLGYVTDKGQASGKVQARIWDNGQNYPLYSFLAGDKYLYDIAQFQGHWYYVAGTSAEQLVEVFKDPLTSIKNPAVGKAIPILALRVPGAAKIGFSDNARFIEAEAGQDFAVYDFETQTGYRYTLEAPLSGPMQWMDGHRLIGQSAGRVLIMDYDSTNQHLLAPTADPQAAYFSGDYNQLVVPEPVAGSGAVALTDIDMRAGTDLPKSLQ